MFVILPNSNTFSNCRRKAVISQNSLTLQAGNSTGTWSSRPPRHRCRFMFHILIFELRDVTKHLMTGPRRPRLVPFRLSIVRRVWRERKSNPPAAAFRALLVPRMSRGHFFLAVFFRVTYDRLSKRRSTRRPDPTGNRIFVSPRL